SKIPAGSCSRWLSGGVRGGCGAAGQARPTGAPRAAAVRALGKRRWRDPQKPRRKGHRAGVTSSRRSPQRGASPAQGAYSAQSSMLGVSRSIPKFGWGMPALQPLGRGLLDPMSSELL
uniref:Uncharacterized protein n=1 Tax=Taeniopygia guttata TaxID=59729 RepID=A0A674GZX7_TAEGU